MKIELRPYQVRAIEQLYEWFEKNPKGHPVLNLPGGSGKSVVIAAIVKDALKNWPETRVLMLVHSRELVAQNADKLRKLWPNAPLGIYSASLNKRQLGEPITYAGIQSVRNKAKSLGHIDICLVDEAHAISNTETGAYRKLLSDLLENNPNMRIVGFSASPYRLGQGMVTEGDEALFDDIVEPVSIEELVYHKHLSPLRSKLTDHKLDTTGLHKRQGDYIASEMEERFNTSDHNDAIALEIIQIASDRKHWLIFCSGIDHAKDFSECLIKHGIAAHFLTSHDSNSIRDQKLDDFKNGKVRAMCNVGILTTGYDFEQLDCIAFLRATQSPGLYLQMAFRGTRIHPNKKDCLVLDFAGVVETHGPITNVKPPKKGGSGDGEAPIKVCDACHEIVHISADVCPNCGTAFPIKEKPALQLRDVDIMGVHGTDMQVKSWDWMKCYSKTSGTEMIKITYYGGLSDKPVKEYLCLKHEGWAGQKAMQLLTILLNKTGQFLPVDGDIDTLCRQMNSVIGPKEIEYRMEGKYARVLDRRWE